MFLNHAAKLRKIRRTTRKSTLKKDKTIYILTFYELFVDIIFLDTLRFTRAFNEKEAYKVSIEHLSDTKELAGGKASTLDFIGIKKSKPVLRIIEIDFLKNKKNK